jgi:PTS system nitrogen regulatory IIA component
MTAPLSVISTGFFMTLLDHLPTDGMMIGLSVNSKKQLLEHISAHAGSLTKVPARVVFDALIKRERLGSTAIGGGMAIPHAVFAELTQSVVIITTLERAVAFDAHDKKPVDIVCTILGPDQADCDHLKLVSAAAKHLADGAVCQALRNAKTASDIRQCFDQHHATAA